MKILLIRLSSMGDLIHTLPAISDLVVHCPDIELHWLCERNFVPIAQLHPFVKHIYPMDWRKWRKHLFLRNTWQQIRHLKQQLRSENYHQIIDSQGLIKSAVFAKLAHSPITGLDFYSARESWASLFYKHKISISKQSNAVFRNRQLFAKAFDYTFDDKVNFGIQIPSEGKIENLPQQYRVALTATSRNSKLWAVENWIALLTLLYQKDELPVLLLWGNEIERQRAEMIARHVPQAIVFNKINLLEAAYLLQNARIVVGVDTGLLHLANAVNTPLLGIYTDSDPNKTGVQTSNYAENLGGIGQIPNVDEVWKAILHIESVYYENKK